MTKNVENYLFTVKLWKEAEENSAVEFTLELLMYEYLDKLSDEEFIMVEQYYNGEL